MTPADVIAWTLAIGIAAFIFVALVFLLVNLWRMMR